MANDTVCADGIMKERKLARTKFVSMTYAIPCNATPERCITCVSYQAKRGLVISKC